MLMSAPPSIFSRALMLSSSQENKCSTVTDKKCSATFEKVCRNVTEQVSCRLHIYIIIDISIYLRVIIYIHVSRFARLCWTSSMSSSVQTACSRSAPTSSMR